MPCWNAPSLATTFHSLENRAKDDCRLGKPHQVYAVFGSTNPTKFRLKTSQTTRPTDRHPVSGCKRQPFAGQPALTDGPRACFATTNDDPVPSRPVPLQLRKDWPETPDGSIVKTPRVQSVPVARNIAGSKSIVPNPPPNSGSAKAKSPWFSASADSGAVRAAAPSDSRIARIPRFWPSLPSATLRPSNPSPTWCPSTS